jgi:hypothetical protein
MKIICKVVVELQKKIYRTGQLHLVNVEIIFILSDT